MVRPSGPGCAVALVALLLSAVADESDPYADLYASLLAGQLPGVLTAAGPGVFDDGRRLAYSYAPKLNATTKRGRLNYTYFSKAPFAYRDTANPWVSLGPDLTLYDASSADLKAAFFAFDGDSWDGDELRYPNAVQDIDGSYDPGSRTLVLWASPAQAKADWLAALRSVLYRAKASLSVKDRPNVHTRVVWISLLDVEGNRGNSFNVTIRAAKESEIPNFKGSYLGRFPLVSANFWTSDHPSERSRSVDAISGTRARGTLMLKRR